MGLQNWRKGKGHSVLEGHIDSVSGGSSSMSTGFLQSGVVKDSEAVSLKKEWSNALLVPEIERYWRTQRYLAPSSSNSSLFAE